MKRFKVFQDMKQYPIDRREFERIFMPLALVTHYESLWSAETDCFKYWYMDDEHYFLHKDSGTLITYYKHVGRCNTCNKKLTIEEYECFVECFLEELKIFYNIKPTDELVES